MTKTVTDIDIDVPNRKEVLKLFPHTRASIRSKGKQKAHNTGVYFHKIPSDPITGLCSLDYKEAERLGYFKIDILNVGLYNEIRSEQHLIELLEKEPVWELLEEKEFCDLLFQLKGHHHICKIMKPRNIEQLAAVLAMIRPAKKHLVGKDWDYVLKHVWDKTNNSDYAFKKSHAIAYALTVKAHMNLISERLNSGKGFDL